MRDREHGALPAGLTLQQAAHELGINVKTLKRWLELESILPAEDPRDRRRRLISPESMIRIRGYLGEVPRARNATDPGPQVEALIQQIALLEKALAVLGTRAAAMEETIIALTQQMIELRGAHDALARRVDDMRQVQPSAGARSLGRA